MGEYVLLHRGEFFKTQQYKKIQPSYADPFKIVKKVNKNAYELDQPVISKKHGVINIRWLKKFEQRSDKYLREKPRTSRKQK